jgi:nucleoside-diphosphate-sugar epimerase
MDETGDTILVLGATSLIGRYLTPLLGRRAIAVSRRPPPEASGRWVAADLEAGPDLPPAATVVSLMPLWLLAPLLPRLVEGGMTRLVAFSSTSRFTKQASAEPAEREVAQNLAEAEAAVMASPAAWTILRPTLIYAEGQDGNVSRLAGIARRFGVLPLAGEGKGLRQPVHAQDLAAAVPLILAAPATQRRAYDLPGGETLSYRAMGERVFEGLGRRPRILTVPPGLWRMAFKLLRPKGATTSMGDRMAEDLVFDARPAQADFGWAPRDFHPDFRPFARRPSA